MPKHGLEADTRYLLRWNRFHHEILTDIETLRQQDELVDASFWCEGELIGVHKLIIYAASSVLKEMLTRVPAKHPVIFITDIKLNVLKSLLSYIYLGEVQVAKADLLDFMRAAETFKVKGLQTDSESVYQMSDDVIEEAPRPVSKKTKFKHETVVVAGPSQTEMELGNMFDIKEDLTHDSGESEMMESMRAYLRNSEGGQAIFDEFHVNSLLTEERKEDLINLICEFIKETTAETNYNKATREAVAEAVLGLFPSVFQETYEQFGEVLRRRIGNTVGIDQSQHPLKELKRRRLKSNLKQIEHDLTVFTARALAAHPLAQPCTGILFNPFQREVNVEAELDFDCNLKTRATCPICKQMITVESVAKRQSKGMKYRFKSSSYIAHLFHMEMWDDGPEHSSTTTIDQPKCVNAEVQGKLFKLAEKWKYDFFSCREANIDNIQEILDNSSTAVTIEHDDNSKMVARIYCVICARPIRIGYLKHNTRNGETYNFSNTNYFHHLKMHSIVKHIARAKRAEHVDVEMIPKIDPNEEETV